MLDRDVVRSNVDEVRSRIAEAADRSGRDPADVTLVAATKTVKVEASRFLPGPDNQAMGMRPKEMYIPENYNAVTELTAEVKPNDEDNVYTFELTGKK